MSGHDVTFERVEKIVTEELELSHAPGFAIGIVKDDQLVLGKGYGFARIDEALPVQTDTVFQLASLSKMFTCIGLMQQWEQGKFELDDPVNKYLPHGKVVVKKPSWPEVTFHHLMTHTSGIGELRRAADVIKKGFRILQYDYNPTPPLSSVHDLNVYPSAPAGQKYAYSNVAVSLLGYLTEIFSGKTFREYMVDHILDPLGMSRSDFAFTDRVMPHLAHGYKYNKKKDVLYKPRVWNNIIKPSGALCSTIEDMAKFARCLLAGGAYSGGRIVKPETFEKIITPQYWAHEQFKDRCAMGYIYWIYRDGEGNPLICHTGGISGFTSFFSFIPARQVAFFGVANLGEGLKKRVTLRVRNRLAKLFGEIVPPEIRPVPAHGVDWTDLKGSYGSYPGWLSSTRVLLEGINFKIKPKKDHLVLTSPFGTYSPGKDLFPTSHPDVFEYPVEEADGIYYSEWIGFTRGEDGRVVEMARGFDKLRRLKVHQTFMFKIYTTISMVILAITIVLVLIIC